MNRRQLLPPVLLASLIAACSPGASSDRVARDGSSVHLIDRIQGASSNVSYEGLRHYEAHVYEAGGDLVVRYSERVSDRGDGCFQIEPLDVQSNVVDPFLFLGLQRERQAFSRRYRDFRIRDVDLFLANYIVRDEGRTELVAGRAALELTVESRASEHRYELSVDEETGIVLAYRELRADGTLLSSLRYEEFRLTSVSAEVDCFTNEIEEAPLPLRTDPVAELGFDVWSPALLPDGYERYEAARVSDPRGFDWYKLSFTDGVETLFFLQRAPEEPRQASLAAGGRPAAAHDDRVYVHDIGTISIVQGNLASREVMAVGKVDSRDLFRLLESSRPN